MALIEYEVEEVLMRERVTLLLSNVRSRPVIRHNDDVNLFNCSPNMLFALTVVDLSIELVLLEEFVDFLLPLVGQSIRTNDQRRQALSSCFPVHRCLIQYDCETLDSLSKAHIVAQRAVQTVSSEHRQPLDALPLVAAERRFRLNL